MDMQVGESITSALTTILFVYRNTPHALTGKTPAEMMLGWAPRTALDQFRVRETKTRNVRHSGRDSSKFSAPRPRSVQHIQPGDWVRVRRPARSHKLASVMSAPIQVTRRYGYTLCLAEGTEWYIWRCTLWPPEGPEFGMLPLATAVREPVAHRDSQYGDDVPVPEREEIAKMENRSGENAPGMVVRRSGRTRKQTEFFRFSE